MGWDEEPEAMFEDEGSQMTKGIEVLREKDRNYIVALFSALVSLVALIVTLVK